MSHESIIFVENVSVDHVNSDEYTRASVSVDDKDDKGASVRSTKKTTPPTIMEPKSDDDHDSKTSNNSTGSESMMRTMSGDATSVNASGGDKRE